jgi:hypothetical protein
VIGGWDVGLSVRGMGSILLGIFSHLFETPEFLTAFCAGTYFGCVAEDVSESGGALGVVAVERIILDLHGITPQFW